MNDDDMKKEIAKWMMDHGLPTAQLRDGDSLYDFIRMALSQASIAIRASQQLSSFAAMRSLSPRGSRIARNLDASGLLPTERFERRANAP